MDAHPWQVAPQYRLHHEEAHHTAHHEEAHHDTHRPRHLKARKPSARLFHLFEKELLDIAALQMASVAFAHTNKHFGILTKDNLSKHTAHLPEGAKEILQQVFHGASYNNPDASDIEKAVDAGEHLAERVGFKITQPIESSIAKNPEWKHKVELAKDHLKHAKKDLDESLTEMQAILEKQKSHTSKTSHHRHHSKEESDPPVAPIKFHRLSFDLEALIRSVEQFAKDELPKMPPTSENPWDVRARNYGLLLSRKLEQAIFEKQGNITNHLGDKDEKEFEITQLQKAFSTLDKKMIELKVIQTPKAVEESWYTPNTHLWNGGQGNI